MFAYLLEKLHNWSDRTEARRLHDYLATSSDLAELERRMCAMERSGYTV